MIGIGLTTHNRREVFNKTLTEIKKFMPNGAKLVIVDDASDELFKGATFRFDKNVGISTAKNKCLELLDDCDDIFLFDDDCYPISKDWYRPYIESGEPHLSYIFIRFINGREVGDSHLLYSGSKINAYTHPRGCMLYLKHECLDAVGGMETGYDKWGFEHVDLSNRIFNAGLTSFRYMDVKDSSKLIYSLDEQMEVASTVDTTTRRKYLNDKRQLFNASFNTDKYCEYKSIKHENSFKNNVVLTCYFAGDKDPQRDIEWEADFTKIQPLINSLKGQKLVVLHNCFDDKLKVPRNVELVKVHTVTTPYIQRWISYYEYLRNNPCDAVWMIDSTDVEMINNPFTNMDEKLVYIGDEQSKVMIPWMLNNHKPQFLQQFFRQYKDKQLLNCGLLGGSYNNMTNFLNKLVKTFCDEKGDIGTFDMGIVNYTAYTHFNSSLSHGSHVNTVFKAYDNENKTAWWRHK